MYNEILKKPENSCLTGRDVKPAAPNLKPKVSNFYAVFDENRVSLECLVYALVFHNILVLTSSLGRTCHQSVVVWLKVKYFREVCRRSLLEFRYGVQITGKNTATTSHKFQQ
jgi:hypothetical protein